MHCCISTPITDSNTSMGMMWVTLNMPSAMEECREPSGKCRGISQSLEREKLAGLFHRLVKQHVIYSKCHSLDNENFVGYPQSINRVVHRVINNFHKISLAS